MACREAGILHGGPCGNERGILLFGLEEVLIALPHIGEPLIFPGCPLVYKFNFFEGVSWC